MTRVPTGDERIGPEWEPHRELLHGIQQIRKELGEDFPVTAAELRITDPTPAGIARQLAAIRARAESHLGRR